jgi:hypothetical protein
MPDLLTIAGPVAASGLIYQVAVGIGLPAQMAMPAAVCAAVGASLALSHGERIEFTLRSILTALAVYFFSLAFGMTVGTAVAMGTMAFMPDNVASKVPAGSVVMACVLVTAAFGVSTILPIALKLVKSRVGAQGGNDA